MNKHTKGPWVLNSGRVESETGQPIAKAYREMSDFEHLTPIYPVERDANMQLVACAPEMLQALKNIVRSAPLVGLSLAMEKDIQSAINVIAKAEGRTE